MGTLREANKRAINPNGTNLYHWILKTVHNKKNVLKYQNTPGLQQGYENRESFLTDDVILPLILIEITDKIPIEIILKAFFSHYNI